MKKNYQTPEVEIITLAVEQGFSTSTPIEAGKGYSLRNSVGQLGYDNDEI